jgi:hypothetical protein
LSTICCAISLSNSSCADGSAPAANGWLNAPQAVEQSPVQLFLLLIERLGRRPI